MKSESHMISDMLYVQARLNDRAYQNWRVTPPRYSLAILAECSEMADAIGWKWWKKQEPRPIAQIQLEVVDIWHFIMSQLLAAHHEYVLYGLPNFVATIKKQHPPSTDLKAVLPVLEALSATSSAFGSAHAGEGIQPGRKADLTSIANGLVHTFGAVMHETRLSVEDLHKLYMGKSVLNLFRWDNGYSEGTYIKNWDGQEDNDYLEKLIASLEVISPESIQKALKERYARVIENQKLATQG